MECFRMIKLLGPFHFLIVSDDFEVKISPCALSPNRTGRHFAFNVHPTSATETNTNTIYFKHKKR